MPRLSSISSITKFLSTLTGNLFTMDVGSVFGSLDVIGKLFSAINTGFKKIGQLGGSKTQSRLTKISSLILAFADPNNTDSTLNMLSAAFQRFQTNLNSWVDGLVYVARQISPRRVARPTGSGLVTGSGDSVSLAGTLTARNIGNTGTTALDLLTERSLVEQGTYLGDQQKAIADAIRHVKNSITHVRHARGVSAATRKSTISQLEGQYTLLIQQQDSLISSMNDNVTQRFQQEQQHIQDTINQVADVYQTEQQQIQTSQSQAQALGQFSQLPSIDQALANSAKAQIAALQPVLREAQKINDPELVAQIQQQISQLQTTVSQATAQIIQDAISAVQQTAQTQQAQVSELQSMAQTQFGAASTPGQFAAAGALNLQALNTNQSSLQSQLSSYNSLLAQAINTGNQGAVASLTQTIDQLTAQLAQNVQAIQDNTTQMVQQAAQFIQSRGQFQTGIYGGLAQVIQTIGQTTGFTDVPTLKALTQASNISLASTQTGLLGQLSQLGGGASGLAGSLRSASTPAQFVATLLGANVPGIESGQDQTWINTFEGLISNLESNTQAIASNNQQLATLNGQLLQPQQWSTTAWSAFRNAIFSGMGNLLPQFQSVLPPGSAPTIAPTFTPVPSGNSAPTIGVLNVNHAPVPAFDASVLGEQMAFEAANAL